MNLERFKNQLSAFYTMGRIKTKLTKRVSLKLFKNNPESFSSTDYAKNKGRVDASLELYSKKLRNVIAGYLTRLKKAEKQKNL